MKKINRILTVIALIFCFEQSRSYAADELLFVIDSSGSMIKEVNGVRQIDAAKEALRGSVMTAPSVSVLGIRAYGHRVDQKNKAESCRDTELVLPLKLLDPSGIEDALRKLEPKGYTPIAYSLEQAAKDFSVAGENNRSIILLSDGEETCGGDPAAVVKKLIADGFKVVVHTIGFNVDSVTRKQLESIALAGNGQYFDAKDSISLSLAMKEATKKALFIEKGEAKTYGAAIRGGDDFDQAIKLESDIEYKLDHNQLPKKYDYFYVDAQAGQQIEVEAKTQAIGVSVSSNGKITENNYPFMGMKILDSARNEIGSMWTEGQYKTDKKILFPNKTERIYFLLGNESGRVIPSEHATFKISIKTFGDLGSDKDASALTKEASPISAQKYLDNSLGGADNIDVFAFDAVKGQSYSVGLIPEDGFDYYFYVKVFDEYKQVLLNEASKNSGAGIKSKTFVIPENGKYYLQISITENRSKVYKYDFELKKESAENTSAEGDK